MTAIELKAKTKMETSMLNITYNVWVRERIKVIDIISNVRQMKRSSKTTDGPHISPLGDHKTRKDDKGDQTSGGEMT